MIPSQWAKKAQEAKKKAEAAEKKAEAAKPKRTYKKKPKVEEVVADEPTVDPDPAPEPEASS